MEEKVTESNVQSSGLLGGGVAWSTLVGAAGGSLEKQQGVGHKPVSEHGEYCQCWLSVSVRRAPCCARCSIPSQLRGALGSFMCLTTDHHLIKPSSVTRFLPSPSSLLDSYFCVDGFDSVLLFTASQKSSRKLKSMCMYMCFCTCDLTRTSKLTYT